MEESEKYFCSNKIVYRGTRDKNKKWALNNRQYIRDSENKKKIKKKHGEYREINSKVFREIKITIVKKNGETFETRNLEKGYDNFGNIKLLENIHRDHWSQLQTNIITYLLTHKINLIGGMTTCQNL